MKANQVLCISLSILILVGFRVPSLAQSDSETRGSVWLQQVAAASAGAAAIAFGGSWLYLEYVCNPAIKRSCNYDVTPAILIGLGGPFGAAIGVTIVGVMNGRSGNPLSAYLGGLVGAFGVITGLTSALDSDSAAGSEWYDSLLQYAFVILYPLIIGIMATIFYAL